MSISISLAEDPVWWEAILTTSGPLLLVIIGGFFAFRNMIAQSNITRHFAFRTERQSLYADYLRQIGITTDAYFTAKRAPAVTEELGQCVNDADRELHNQLAIIQLTCPTHIFRICNQVYEDQIGILATLIKNTEQTVSEKQQNENYILLLRAMTVDLKAIETSKDRREYEKKLKKVEVDQ